MATGNRPDHKAPVVQIILGLLIPVLGVVLAIILLARGRGSHGAAVLTSSALGLLVALVLFSVIDAADTTPVADPVATETPYYPDDIPARQELYKTMGYESAQQCADDLGVSVAVCNDASD